MSARTMETQGTLADHHRTNYPVQEIQGFLEGEIHLTILKVKNKSAR